MLCGLIMAGGKGTRFWPLSTEEKPKQFLKLIGDKTMIQMTVDRIQPIIPIERIFVCTGAKYVELVKEQLPFLPERNIIIEPEGRNTAPCIALSGMIIKRYYNDASMIVLPADHLIKDEEKFREIIIDGAEYSYENEDTIITLGMEPTRPEIGYGYIKFNGNEKVLHSNKIIEVDKFVEKPNIEKAMEYLENGNYLWNGGMFIWTINHILNEIKKHIPNTYEVLKNIMNVPENELQKEINQVYSRTDSISIDYAILEKAKKINVIPSNIGWDDIGTWKSVERYKEKDYQNNIISDNVKVIECESNMAINNNKKMVMIGVHDILTVETKDAIFIVNKEYMDNLRDYKEVL